MPVAPRHESSIRLRLKTAALLVGIAALRIPKAGRAQARDLLDGLDAYVTSAMKDWKIPGVAIGIVHNDSVIYAKGFGVRTIGRAEKVWHFNTFKATWRDHRDGWNLANFVIDPDGKVDTFRTDMGGPPEEMPVMKKIPDPAPPSSSDRQ